MSGGEARALGWTLPLLVFSMLAAPALRLARRPGKAERSVAAFFVASAVGFSFRLLAVRDGAIDSGGELALNAIGHLALSSACVALFVFTRTVFRPTEIWALRLQQLGTLAAVLTLGGVFVGSGLPDEQARAVILANAVRTVSHTWCLIEAFRYWRGVRRRVALGLAEPVVANRFGLWCVWIGGLTGCLGTVLTIRVVGVTLDLGTEPLPSVLRVVALFVLTATATSAIAIWLSFFPPSRYLDWVEKRATRSPSESASRDSL